MVEKRGSAVAFSKLLTIWKVDASRWRAKVIDLVLFSDLYFDIDQVG